MQNTSPALVCVCVCARFTDKPLLEDDPWRPDASLDTKDTCKVVFMSSKVELCVAAMVGMKEGDEISSTNKKEKRTLRVHRGERVPFYLCQGFQHQSERRLLKSGFRDCN